MLTQHLLTDVHQNTLFFLKEFLCLLPFPTQEDLILNTRGRKVKNENRHNPVKNLDLWSLTLKIFFLKHQACELKLPPGSYNLYSQHLAGNPSAP